MCGIAGFTMPRGPASSDRQGLAGDRLRRMTASLHHRGPDAKRGILLDGIALGSTRLAIVDLAGGSQPMRDPQTGVTIVFNGEIFNHPELRQELAATYAFRTNSDTEVILAAYLGRGIDCVLDFNGQFAFALYDPRTHALWLARDRVGILPLYYARTADGLAFASEAKALFAGGWCRPILDAIGLKQALQLWSPVPPRTLFQAVSQLDAGCVARWWGGVLETRRYWDIDLGLPSRDIGPAAAEEELGALLEDAVRLRLRADVPVAAYLSGGLDSSALCGIAQKQLGGTLSSFSVGFEDSRYDERVFQNDVAARLRTNHHSILVSSSRIGEVLPDVVYHAEQVLLRSAPAPLFDLSALVRDSKTKVVLSGEGADEIFLGYELYRETQIRQFWGREPHSTTRPALLRRLYPYLGVGSEGQELFRQFFGVGLERLDDPSFSHSPRWSASGRIFRFLDAEYAAGVSAENPVASVVAALPTRMLGWTPLARAQYLEMRTLLAGYLLSAQGDRMLMAHSVEGRYPYLDHRVIEFAATLPARLKLRGLREKWLLKRYAARWVPPSILERTKYPYRAPIAAALVGPQAPRWTHSLLAPDAVRDVGVFDEAKVGRLIAKMAARPGQASESDGQTIMAVATTQLLAEQFRRRLDLDRRHVEAVELEAA
ncbi:MAG: asparagine synthase (glutamine-hydrolyzing) [Deltaproteobacteria bacterium]|nr:MAG: asparagine synthase (glutamine-hydrolyzing) [Deltaproteobacteria bacterium]HTD64835.1 asparagine synthase (glutamine-hydrolyzing) [Verrucomicrobiae bacterium]